MEGTAIKIPMVGKVIEVKKKLEIQFARKRLSLS